MSGLPWNAEALSRQLQARWPGIGVEVVAETASTSSDLLARLRPAAESAVRYRGGSPGSGAEAFAPCLLVAERQTAGRGRLGRSWHSLPGRSLTFSVAIELARPDLSGSRWRWESRWPTPSSRSLAAGGESV
jgi:BirA family biotin operon repressor/biotin-[acetyl-CoA-carboxylase] ligase